MERGLVITRRTPKLCSTLCARPLYSLKQGDQVRIFLSGRGVDSDKIAGLPSFTVVGEGGLEPESLDAGAGTWLRTVREVADDG